MRSDYRADIDGLRAVAVLSVVFCHAGLHVPGGFVGVDVFFVISGFLITRLILAEINADTFSLINFWERRIRRILPALFVMVIATLVAGYFTLMPEAYESLGKSAAAVALLISNLNFWSESGYFDHETVYKPLLHTWSLAVEEQFYLFVPVCLLLLKRSNRLRWTALLLTIGAIISFAWSVYGTYKYPSATFYLLPTRAWELFTGGILCVLPQRPFASLRTNEASAVIGMTLILIPCFVYSSETRFPGVAALSPVIGTALLIKTGTDNVRGRPLFNRLLSLQPWVFIGLVSYSLYLWHWPLFAFTRSLTVDPPRFPIRILLVIASFVVGALSWRLVEVPLRNRRVLSNRPTILSLAVVAQVTLIAVGSTIYHQSGLVERWPARIRLYAETGRRDPAYIHELSVTDIPQNLVWFGSRLKEPTVFVWGDSHAMAILPAIESLSEEFGIATCAATRSSTAPIYSVIHGNRKWDTADRADFNSAVLDYIKAKRLRIVVLVANWGVWFDQDGFPEALGSTVDALHNCGTTVYFIKDVPHYDYNVARTLTLSAFLNTDSQKFILPHNAFAAENDMQAPVLADLSKRGVIILDPLPVLQARTKSLDIIPFDELGTFYRDGQHLSTYGALALKPLFTPIFEQAKKLVN